MLRVSDLRDGGDVPGWDLGTAIDAEVAERVRGICERVRAEGDAALVDLTRELDGADVEGRLRVSTEELTATGPAVPGPLREAIERMAGRLRDLHRRQLPRAWEAVDQGVRYGEVIRPIGSVGCYVPGGRAAYPSTVLMTAIPARVAGVPRVTLCTPPAEDGSIAPVVLHAARVAGVDEVFRVGGAQAVAALAYGTGSIPPVDKIVGPGNVWVTAAKREVSGLVGVDAPAGPTELVVVADGSADPRVLAADLVAQAEHDPLARALLVCVDDGLAERVELALAPEVARTPRREIVEDAMAGALALVVTDESHAAEVVDALAPEHLQVVTADPAGFLDRVTTFGAAFLGPRTPVAFGDYGVGSNHVLPTMGTARFASGLRASDFVRVASFVEASEEGLAARGPDVELVAAAEGLPGHARAVAVRR